ncbi:hypothetical protein L2778_000838 [Vibrio vulnificus]|nr:hypothetical protein [Vibrio vulnificus]
MCSYLIRFFILFFITSASSSYSDEVRNSDKVGNVITSGGDKFQPTTNVYKEVKLSTLDNKSINIYKIDGTGNGNHEVYVYTPQVIYDSKLIKEKYNKELSNNDGKFPISISFPIFTRTDRMLEEISKILSVNKTVAPSQLLVIEHYSRFIYAEIMNQDYLLYNYPSLKNLYSLQLSKAEGIHSYYNVIITFNSPAEAKSFFENPKLKMMIVHKVDSVSTANANFNLEDFINSENFNKLTGSANEHKEKSIRTVSDNGGISIDLEVAKIGSSQSASEVEITDRHERWINDNQAREIVNEYISDAKLRFICQGMSNSECNDFSTRFYGYINKLISRNNISRYFDIQYDKQKEQYAIIDTANAKRYANAYITKGALVKLKDTSELQSKDDKSFDFMKIFSADDTRESKISSSNGIDWELKGSEWVPVGITLYQYNREKLSSSLKYSMSQMVINDMSKHQIIEVEGVDVRILDDETIPNTSKEIFTLSQLKNYVDEKISYIPSMIVDISGPTKIVRKINAIYMDKMDIHYGGHSYQFTGDCEQPPKPEIGFEYITSRTATMQGEKRKLDNQTSYYRNSNPNDPKITKCIDKNNALLKAAYCDGAGEHCAFRKNGFLKVECSVNIEWLKWNEEKLRSPDLSEEQRKIRSSNNFKCSM